MASWTDFENASPEMAEAGKKLLYQYGVGIAFLATVRKDGAPRLHPICPTVVNGRLYALIGPSHKRATCAAMDATPCTLFHLKTVTTSSS